MHVRARMYAHTHTHMHTHLPRKLILQKRNLIFKHLGFSGQKINNS